MREFWEEREEPIRQKPFFSGCPFFYILAERIYKDIDKDKLLEAIQNLNFLRCFLEVLTFLKRELFLKMLKGH